MHLFRVRLILALIASVTLVSLASTYFDVLAHRHSLREDLERRTKWMGMSIEPDVRKRTHATGDSSGLPGLTQLLKDGTGALGLAIYDAHGNLLAGSGPPDVMAALGKGVVEKSLQRGVEAGAFGHAGQWQWLEQTFPIHDGDQLQGAMAIVVDAGYIRSEGIALWRRSFWRIVAFVIVIVAITFLMVRWFLLRPMSRAVERLRLLAHRRCRRIRGIGPGSASPVFAAGARGGDHGGKPESRARRRRSRGPPARGRREPVDRRAAGGAHPQPRRFKQNLRGLEPRAVHARAPGTGNRLRGAAQRPGHRLEPVLRACDGVWVASGSGDADAATVDEFDRLRVPPDDPRYTLRRVWLSEEEESRYYEGFSNEGLWPLCHIAHTRPIFRAADWECYQRVNQQLCRRAA